MTDDAELLRQYVQSGSEDAFAELVQRHLPVVYSSALRRTHGDVELAKDICQTVFIDLGRKAGSLLGHELLIGWLFSATRYAAATVLRANRRRQIRERIAVSMHEDAATSALESRDPKLASALDMAMEELTSEDRNAVLLRFFQGEEFKDVGTALGLSEDAARMRVTRAVGKLHSLLESRGVTVSGAALGSILPTEAVTAVPAGLAATISAAALAGIPPATTATATATVAKAIAMTTLQKTLITATVAALAGAGIYQARQAATLRTQVQTLRQQQGPMTEHLRQLQREGDEAKQQQAALRDENERLNRDAGELLKLRGEVARLRYDSRRVAQLSATNTQSENDAFQSEGIALAARARRLKQLFEQMPERKIPELRFLEGNNDFWVIAGRTADLETDAGVSKAMSDMRRDAKQCAANFLSAALERYASANAGHLPAEVSQLKPYFGDDAILQRYEMVNTGNVSNLLAGEKIMAEKSPVDSQYDTLFQIRLGGWSWQGVGANKENEGGGGGNVTLTAAQPDVK